MAASNRAAVVADARPVTLLILALGGEGGGVLHDWIVDAAIEAGWPVQATSIPGVAQRTGATSYYIEILPMPQSQLGGLQPVFCLSPTPGEIDLLVSSELLETARALERGLASPSRTTLVSSTSRFLTVEEKAGMGDGRWDPRRVPDLAHALSRRAVLFDMAQASREAGTVISAVMFGAIAATGVLPLTREGCEAMVRRSGRGVEASLRGFAAGFDAVRATSGPMSGADQSLAQIAAPTDHADAHVERNADVDVQGTPLPAPVAHWARLGFDRLSDWQDADWARQYLSRVAGFVALERRLGGDGSFQASSTAARFLAPWMSYEDVIRVADLKTRAARFERIRVEVGARPDEPVIVRDYLKPGLEEIAAIAPPALSARLLAWGARRKRRSSEQGGLKLQTSSIPGMLALRFLARLKPVRRRSARFAQECALIERWSQALSRALAVDAGLAREIAECPRLLKGYGDTHARGRTNFLEILQTLIEAPWPQDRVALDEHVSALRRARVAALADPEGRQLAAALGRPAPPLREQPIRFVSMKRKR